MTKYSGFVVENFGQEALHDIVIRTQFADFYALPKLDDAKDYKKTQAVFKKEIKALLSITYDGKGIK